MTLEWMSYSRVACPGGLVVLVQGVWGDTLHGGGRGTGSTPTMASLHGEGSEQEKEQKRGRESSMVMNIHYECTTLYNTIIVQYGVHVYQYKIRGGSSEQ